MLRAPLVIVNPASRGGATGRSWPRAEAMLRDTLGEIQVEQTRGRRDAERIAREAARAGVDRLVVAGGDGTTSEVASGVLSAGLADRTRIAVLPLGTGGDLARMLGTPRNLERAVEALGRGLERRIDAGCIHYRGRDGQEKTSYFLNVVSFGLSGLVNELVDRAPKWLGGRVAFLIGTVRGILHYRCREVTVSVDGKRVHTGPLLLAAVANGSCFGGGMRIAPHARLDDGRFDVVTIAERSKLQQLVELSSIYRGTHLDHPAVNHWRAKLVEADAPEGQVWLDVDGEAIGTLPARIELLPDAITLFGVDKLS
ncbi:MAG: diacylglycerol kinase family protein [Myxococcota bacterium]